MINCKLAESISDEIHQAQIDGSNLAIIKYYGEDLETVKKYALKLKEDGYCKSFYFWGGRLVLILEE